MTFNKLTQKPPVRKKNISVLLEYQYDEQENVTPAARYRFTLVDEDDNKVHDPLSAGELLQYLSAEGKEHAKALMDEVEAKVNGRLG